MHIKSFLYAPRRRSFLSCITCNFFNWHIVRHSVLFFVLSISILAGCKKSKEYRENANIDAQKEFEQHPILNGKNLSGNAALQLKKRYGNVRNWGRFVQSFKARHTYGISNTMIEATAITKSTSVQKMSQSMPRQLTITLLDPETKAVIARPTIYSNRYILDQLEEQGFNLPYSDRSGASSTDAARVTSGVVDQSDQSFLSDNQINAGFVLLSVAYALSDLTIITHQEDNLFQFNWDEWYGGGSSGGGGNNYNNNLSSSTYKGVVYTPLDFPGKAANMPWMWWVNSNLSWTGSNLVVEMMDEEMEEASEVNQPCGATARIGNLKFPGTVEHWLIQLDYLKRYSDGMREFGIPNAGPTCSNKGYADLVNMLTKEMFEIKPDNLAGRTCGAADIMNYVSKANLYCITKGWIRGNNYSPVSIRAGSRVLTSKLVSVGVIGYTWDGNGQRPVPVAPQSVIDQLKELLKLMVYAGENYNYILVTFMENNPEVVNCIKTALIGTAVVTVVGTILEDIGTGGWGIADD